MKQISMQDRARTLFDMTARIYNDTGVLQPAILFDLHSDAGDLTSEISVNHVSDSEISRDALAIWVRKKCNELDGHVVNAVYLITEGWSNRADMLPAEIIAAVNKYEGGPRNWPDDMRCEKIIVTGEDRARSVTVSGVIHPATRVVGEPKLYAGASEGRMSRFFEKKN